MSCAALCIKNVEQLRREWELRPLLERVADLVAPDAHVREIVAEERKPSESEGWMCLMAGPSRGIALQLAGLFSLSSPMRRALSRAQLARRLAAAFSSRFPHLVWEENTRPGDDWLMFTIRYEAGECLCACTISMSELIPVRDEQRKSARFVHVELVSEFHSLESLEVGVAELPIRLPALHVRGVLRVSEGGMVSVRIDETDSAGFLNRAFVRLDLGEIEIGLSELLGLQPGSVIELGSPSPLPCALRIGTTSLVQGVIESIGTTIRLRITEGLENR